MSTALLRKVDVVVKGRLLSSKKELLLCVDTLKITEVGSGKANHVLSLAHLFVDEENAFGDAAATSLSVTVATENDNERQFTFQFESPLMRSEWLNALLSAIHNVHLARYASEADAEVQLGIGWKHQIHRGTLHSACLLGDMDTVRLILQRVPTCLDRLDERSRTALHYACLNDHKAIVELLVVEGADPSNVDATGSTPVHVAAAQGHANTIRFLLGHSQIEDFDEHTQRSDSSPAWNAALSGKPRASDCVDALARFGFGVDLVDGDGDTLLHRACESAHEAVVRTLLDHSASPIDCRDAAGLTLLHRAVAAVSPSESTVSALLWRGSQPNAVVHSPDPAYVRALHLASSKRIAFALVSRGARLDLQDANGRSVTHAFNAAFVDVQLRSAAAKYSRSAFVNSTDAGDVIDVSKWTPNEESLVCEACEAPFGVFVWKHHCRRCGILLCFACSTKRMLIGNEQERVCDACFNVLVDKAASLKMDTPLWPFSSDDELEKMPTVLPESPPDLLPISATQALDEFQRIIEPRSAFAAARLKLSEREEKLDEMQCRSEQVRSQAQSFNDLAKRLAQKNSSGW